MRWVLSILGALTLLGASYAVAVWLGAFGRAERDGAPTEVHRPVPLVQAGVEAQRRAAQSLAEASDKQIRRFRLARSCRSCPESCGK